MVSCSARGWLLHLKQSCVFSGVGRGFFYTFFLELGVGSIILFPGFLVMASLYAGVCTNLWKLGFVCAIAGS